MIMLGRVLVRGIIAAPNVTADLAKTKMNPTTTYLETILTSVGAGRHRDDQLKVFA